MVILVNARFSRRASLKMASALKISEILNAGNDYNKEADNQLL